MEADVREALRHLITAFENHLEAVASRRSPDDAAVDDAYEALAEAFERYEEALDLEFAEGLPLVVDDAEDADFDLEDSDDADDGNDGDFTDTEDIDAHAEEDEDEMDDDLEEFDLRD